MLSSWTAPRIDLLETLWADGLSASQIAARLGGTTRNAVIGRVYRMGLPARVKNGHAPRPRPAIRRAAHAARRSAMLPDTPVQRLKRERFIPQPEPVIPPHERKPILVRKDDGLLHANDDLTAESCRWPCGDTQDADFGFCGREKIPGIPYCAAHARIAFQALNPQPPGRRQRPPAEAARAVEKARVTA